MPEENVVAVVDCTVEVITFAVAFMVVSVRVQVVILKAAVLVGVVSALLVAAIFNTLS